MALSSTGSYIPTANEFLAHWAEADAALLPGGLVLAGEPGVIPAGFNRSGLLVLRDAMQADLDNVQDKLNDLQIVLGSLELQKAALYQMMTLFLGVMDGYYVNTEYYRARPEAPGLGAGEERFVGPLRDVQSLWLKLNAAPAPSGVTLPLTVNVGTAETPNIKTQANFVAALNTLKGTYAQRAEAEQEVKLARSKRDKTMRSIRAVLVAYRAAAETRLTAHPALLATLPRVTPLPGHTPEKVNISAVFAPPDTAQVTHSESDDPDFKEYQFRGTVGDDGSAEDATVLATHTARTPVPFSTQLGLGIPGGAVSLWVFVITNDGNERASDRAVVQRPI